jgi:DNA-binding HxlR family transcriptional regulator
MRTRQEMECPFEDLLALVCRKWPLLVIATVGKKGERRFVELMRDLKGVSPRSLSQVLEELTELHLLVRTDYKGIPPRVGYSLTEMGKELTKAVRPLLAWASEMRPEKDCPILKTIRGF